MSRTSNVLNARVSPGIEAELKSQAARAGVPLATYLRAVLEDLAGLDQCPRCRGSGLVHRGSAAERSGR